MLNDLLNVFEQDPKNSTDDKLRQLLDFLIEKNSLIILDDVHNLFAIGQFAGQYQPEYNNYRNLFKIITETDHQSHLILVSQER